MSSILNAVLGRSPANTTQLPSEKNNEVKSNGEFGEDGVGEAVQVVEEAVHDQDDYVSLALRFADKDIHDPDTILMELMSGPSISIDVGPNKVRYTMPKRLLLYHSPAAAGLLSVNAKQTGIDGLSLPNDSPEAFANLHRWFFQKRLGILEQYAASSIYEGLTEACTLLCRLFQLAKYLEIGAIQPVILAELTAAVELARDMGKCTPILANTVLEAYHDVGDASPLWKFILVEMCADFSRLPRPNYSAYEVCFKSIESFRVTITRAMISQVNLVLDREEFGTDAKTPKEESEGSFEL